MTTTNVYVDGYNFYYGVVKGTRYKWLDLEALCRRLLPGSNIQKITYATARVHAVPWDLDVTKRQEAYLLALSTLPLLEVVEGTYSQKVTSMPLVNPRDISKLPGPRDYPRVNVLKHEEKGSDVSLGARLVFDACQGAFDTAVVFTNDSDLFEPVRLVRDELGKRVEQFVPTRPASGKYRGRKSVYRGRVDQIYHEINESALEACQLPDPVSVRGVMVAKPGSW